MTSRSFRKACLRGQAIQTVEAEGVIYVTAAGNDAGNGYQASWMPISAHSHLTEKQKISAIRKSVGGGRLPNTYNQHRRNRRRRSFAAGMESGVWHCQLIDRGS